MAGSDSKLPPSQVCATQHAHPLMSISAFLSDSHRTQKVFQYRSGEYPSPEVSDIELVDEEAVKEEGHMRRRPRHDAVNDSALSPVSDGSGTNQALLDRHHARS